MKTYVYFKILVVDLTDDIMSKSLTNNPYSIRRTVEADYVMLKFNNNNVPIDLFKRGYSSLTRTEAVVELALPIWDVIDIPTLPFSNTKSFSFDGLDESVDLGNVYNPNQAQAFSYSMWLKPQNVAAQRVLISRAGPSPNVHGLIVQHKAGGQIYIQVRTTGTLTFNNYTAVLTAGVWQHLVITFDGSGLMSGLKVHLDGVWDGYSNGGGIAGVFTGLDNLMLGVRSTSGFGFFSGNMNQVTRYNKELSTGEITEIYNNGTPLDARNLGSASNLESMWELNSNLGLPTVTDLVGTADGTVVNMDASNVVEDVP